MQKTTKKPTTLRASVFAVYKFLRDYIKLHGFSPTFRETVAGSGLSTRTVALALKSLKEGGYIASAEGKHRNLTIIKPLN